jgi:hypothetical protein
MWLGLKPQSSVPSENQQSARAANVLPRPRQQASECATGKTATEIASYVLTGM